MIYGNICLKAVMEDEPIDDIFLSLYNLPALEILF